MNESPQLPENNPTRPQRPQVLTILCVLSFIGSGMAGMSFLMIYSSYSEMMSALKDFSTQFPGMDLILSARKGFFLTGFVLYFLSFIGVSLMWRMRKAGFHFYTASQVFITFLPIFYIKGYPFPLFDVMFTALFIFLYSRFYRLFV